MKRETFDKLIKEDIPRERYSSKKVDGILIMRKYIPGVDIGSAEHDEIWASCAIDELIEAGITEEDVTKLAEYGWRPDDWNEGLAHFV